jgi:hypothetical protein
MTHEKMRVIIAEHCGWIRDDVCDCWNKPAEGPHVVAFLTENRSQLRQIPDYLNDLNACAEMENYVKDWNAYSDKCESIARRDGKIDRDINPSIIIDVLLIRLSADQRCEAFLRTIGKWEDK